MKLSSRTVVEGGEPLPARRSQSPVRLASLIGTVAVIAMTVLVGLLAQRALEARSEHQRHELFLQVARDGAVNFTTIDWTRVDADIQRLLDGATGDFHREFANGAQRPFVEVVKRTKARTVGTVTESGLQSATATDAKVLVTVTVKTSNEVVEDETSRSWRLRVSVYDEGQQMKVSKMEILS